MSRGAATAISGLLMVLLLVSAAWAKPPDGISIDIEVGYNGWVQLGRINPVIVEMENSSADLNLSGELVLDHAGVEYTSRLELPTPSRKRFFLYFPCGNYPPVLVLRVRTRTYTESFEIPTHKHTLDAANANILVLTRQAGSLGVLNQMPGVRMYRNLHRGQFAELGSSTSFVAYYDVSEVDANPKFFGCADIIIVADVDYQRVTSELAEALKASVAGGKSLVFSLGLSGSGVAGSPLAELCPLIVSGTTQTLDLGSFGSRYGFQVGDAPATLAVGSVAPGADVLSWAGQHPVVVRTLRGSGRVTALAFDFTAVPFKQNPALQPLFVDAALKVEDSVQVTDWFIHPQSIGDQLKNLGEARPLSWWFVLLFLAAYVLLIGPANFLILGRLKRRTLVWTTIPVIIAGFSYLGLYTGYFYRGSDNVLACFQELHIYPGTDYVPYQTTLLVFTAERTHYQLRIPDESAFVYPDVPAVMDQPAFGGGGGFRGLSGGKIDNSRQPVVDTIQGKWTQKVYCYQGYAGMQASAESRLAATRASRGVVDVRGDFALDLPFDLQDCELLHEGGGVERLGDLAGRGTYEPTGSQTNIRGGLSQVNYLTAARESFRSALRSSVRPGMEYRNELLLTGFTEDVQVLAEFERPHVRHYLTLVVVHLPFEEQLRETGDPEVTRRRLVGGAGFAGYDQGRGQSYGPQFYSLPANAYMDIGFELGGRVKPTDLLGLSLRVFDAKEDYQHLDLAAVLEGAVWDGAAWRRLRVPTTQTYIDIPVGDSLGEDRQMIVRLKARRDLILELPTGDVLSGG